MTNRSNDYFVKINPHFLFDTFEIFKSYFTPWVYLYLKLEKNFLITKPIHNEFKIINKDLCEFFMVDRSTIYRSIQELIKYKLLEKTGSKYKISDEDHFINRLKLDNQAKHDEQLVLNEKALNFPDENLKDGGQTGYKLLEKLPEFIMIYQNEFLKLRSEVPTADVSLKKYPRSIIKIIEIYYFLTSSNRHCLLEDIDILECDETQTSISRKLKHDNRFTNVMLHVLYKLDYIELYEVGRMATIKKKITGYFHQDVETRISPLNNKTNNLADKYDKEDSFEEEHPKVATEEDRALFDNAESNYLHDINTETKLNAALMKSQTESITQKAEPVSVEERLGYIYMISKNDIEVFGQKAMDQGIPFDDIALWLENNNMAA